MEAYTQTITKREFVKELKAHQKADNFLRGRYWDGAKGCAVGCSLKSIATLKKLDIKDFSNHKHYETHLGIPEWLARVEDTIFEGVSIERSKTWPVEFAQAIKTGADLEKAKTPFLVLILKHTLESMSAAKYDEDSNPDVKAAIAQSKAAVKQMIKAHQSGDSKAIDAAASAAWSAAASASAAWSAWSAAESAARSAARSAESAAWSAWSAARSAESAAWSAESAAWSAWSAESAAWSAESAAWSAWSAAWSAAYEYYADGLIKILKSIK